MPVFMCRQRNLALVWFGLLAACGEGEAERPAAAGDAEVLSPVDPAAPAEPSAPGSVSPEPQPPVAVGGEDAMASDLESPGPELPLAPSDDVEGDTEAPPEAPAPPEVLPAPLSVFIAGDST